MVARAQVRPLRPGSSPESGADDRARRHPGHLAVGGHHALDADDDARSAAPGLHPHGLGQGVERAPGGHPSRAPQRADPGGDADRSPDSAADRWRRHHGADLRHPGHGVAARGSGGATRLPDHHGCLPRDRRRRHAGQPAGGPELRHPRSAGEIPLMATLAADVLTGPLAERGAVADFVGRLVRDKPLGAFAALVFLLFLLCGVLAGVLSPHGMNEISPINRMKPPSLAFPFGTDNLGRDMLSRLLYGARLSVIIGFCAATLATALSVLIGVTSGYLGGRYDMIVQRLVDAWMTFPDLVILIAVVSVVGPGMPQIIVILGLLYGISGSRIIRGAVIAVRENLYVQAAQAMGSGTARILGRHLLPNVLPPIIVLFTTRVGLAILTEAGLSFLGLGVPPPAPTWGGMLSGSGRAYMYQGPWLALAPGLCLTVVVYAINVFGDALRDLLDPRLRGSR